MIPSYNETGIADTLRSLYACAQPNCSVHIIIVINEPQNCEERITQVNQKTYKDVVSFINNIELQHFTIDVQYHIFPTKDAGVGLARKIGMDTAHNIFTDIATDGVIVNLDADCTVSYNYLAEIENAFYNTKTSGASIYYEHPHLQTDTGEIYEGAVLYEIFLRYYIQALRYAEHPYIFHTLGSCMAVRSSVYHKQGGMNKRKAGEDFYFLNKIIPLGNYKEINTCTVYPSARISDRVPFGTGRAMMNWHQEQIVKQYNFAIFKDLKIFFDALINIYEQNFEYTQLPEPVLIFLQKNDYQLHIKEIRMHTSGFENFRKRFFRWFDAFLCLKYVHFARDNYYTDRGLLIDVAELRRIDVSDKNSIEVLQMLRGIDNMK
ncbi:MAG: hypothetical protein NW207_12545 [Cytophagales bacterium]|nr:hypothetical protein [Cytophagales bacterium]